MATTSENPLLKIWDFYIEQYDQLAPKLKQGIEDWYDYSGKALDQYLKLQEEFWGKLSPGKGKTGDVTEQGKSFAQSVINFQKDLSVSAVDVLSKGVRSARNQAAEKTTLRTDKGKTQKAKRKSAQRSKKQTAKR